MATPKTYLALDYGSKRIGLAVGNDLTETSQPIAAIATQQLFQADGKIVTENIGKLIDSWKIDHLVFGAPLDAEGNETHLSRQIKKLGTALGAELALPVSFADERYSSGTADRMIREHHPRGKKFNARKIALRDSIAAQLILEAFFACQA